MKSIPDILRELRTSKSLTQSDVAKVLGLSTNAYQSYERGTSEPGCKALIILANFYGVSTDCLLGREPAPNPFADYGLSETSEKDMLDQYMSFPPEIRAVLMDVLIKLADSAKPESEIVEETTAGELHDRMESETDSEENAV